MICEQNSNDESEKAKISILKLLLGQIKPTAVFIMRINDQLDETQPIQFYDSQLKKYPMASEELFHSDLPHFDESLKTYLNLNKKGHCIEKFVYKIFHIQNRWYAYAAGLAFNRMILTKLCVDINSYFNAILEIGPPSANPYMGQVFAKKLDECFVVFHWQQEKY